MTNRLKIYSTILLFFLLLCSFKTLQAQDTVKISGTSEDVKMNRLDITESPSFPGSAPAPPCLVEQYNDTGHFNLNFALKQPKVLQFNSWYKYWLIYVKPGDSLTFKITGSKADQKIVFSGKNANRYNFFAMVSDVVTKAPHRTQNMDLLKYKDSLDDWKKRSDKLLESYLATRPVDKETADLARNKINYRYVRLIYYVMSASKDEVIPNNFAKEADTYSFNQDRLLSLIEYRYAIYNKFITSKEGMGNTALQSIYQNIQSKTQDKVAPNDAARGNTALESSYINIQSKLKGKTRDFALANLTGTYATKQSAGDRPMLRKLFNELYKKDLAIRDLTYLKDNEMRYFIIGKPLPDNILNNTYLMKYSDNKTLNLVQLLDAYKGKAVYIDLWASWCAPCRNDIKNSAEGKKLLSDNGIAYLYFSTDNDNEAWKKASAEDQITANQYCFESDKYQEFKDFIELAGIPRYILLDENHHVKNLFAPRPTPYFAKEFTKNILELSAN